MPGISHKWNNTICGLLQLVSFTKHHSFRLISVVGLISISSVGTDNVLLYGYATFYLSIQLLMGNRTARTF